jgi:DNA-binding winged helix-turn-helix (wHTH) protein
MTTKEQAAELLKPYRAEVLEEREGFFFGKLSSIGTGTLQFKIAVSSVEDFLKVKDTLHSDQETVIFHPGYYEQAVETTGPGPAMLRLFSRDRTGYLLTSPNNSITIDLSPASESFLFHVGTTDAFKMFRRRIIGLRLGIDRRTREEGETPQLRDYFGRVLTVKVKALGEDGHGVSKSKLRELAVSGLFNISFATGVGLTMSTSWERSIYRLGRGRAEEPQFPRRIYNKELTAYYQLALSSDSPILAYLALYKVLEFFFTSASESVLHKRLADKIAHPDFTHKSAGQLRQIASMVRKFDQKMDEQRMLATVLEQNFMADEISTWVTDVESAAGVYFTQPQTIFGQSMTLDINTEGIYSSLATRIYFIRNALVHNKEGELARFTPFSGQEAALFKETPLLIFLAEGLIAKTGTDI